MILQRLEGVESKNMYKLWKPEYVREELERLGLDTSGGFDEMADRLEENYPFDKFIRHRTPEDEGVGNSNDAVFETTTPRKKADDEELTGQS
jgi:hypothetical protein